MTNKRKPTLDELASKVRLAEESQPDPHDPVYQARQEANKPEPLALANRAEELGKAQMNIDWEAQKPLDTAQTMARIAEDHPADLNRPLADYTKRHDRFWSEKDLEDMEKAEKQHANKGFVNWE